MPDKAKSTNYKREFNAQNYDRIELTVKKGEKEKLKFHATAHSETLNGFINRAIAETVQRDNSAPSKAGKETEVIE